MTASKRMLIIAGLNGAGEFDNTAQEPTDNKEHSMGVRQPRYSKEEFARRGQTIYEQRVRPQC